MICKIMQSLMKQSLLESDSMELVN